MNIYRIADKDIIFNDNSHKSYENLIKRAQRPIPCVDSHISRHKRAQRPIPCVDSHISGLKRAQRPIPRVDSHISGLKRAQRPIPCVDGHASAKKKHPRLVAGTLSFVLRKSLVCGRTFT